MKEEKVNGRNEKRMVAKLSSSVCQFPLTSQKWPIMFNILSLSGGGKEQRCRVGRLEESSVANSIVNIIPYHLLPVKAQAKFVLRRTHSSPVAKKQRDTEWATRAPWSTLPWKLCQLLRRLPSSNTKKSPSKNVRWNLWCAPLYSGRQQSGAVVKRRLCVRKSTPIRTNLWFRTQGQRGRGGERTVGWRGRHMWISMKRMLQSSECRELSAEGGEGLVSVLQRGIKPPAGSCCEPQCTCGPVLSITCVAVSRVAVAVAQYG